MRKKAEKKEKPSSDKKSNKSQINIKKRKDENRCRVGEKRREIKTGVERST